MFAPLVGKGRISSIDLRADTFIVGIVTGGEGNGVEGRDLDTCDGARGWIGLGGGFRFSCSSSISEFASAIARFDRAILSEVRRVVCECKRSS